MADPLALPFLDLEAQRQRRQQQPKKNFAAIVTPESASIRVPFLQVGDKKGKPPRVLMDLPLFHRRKTLYLTARTGRLNPASLRQLALQFECDEQTLLNDWADRDNWVPFIFENEQAHEDGKDILAQIHLAKEEALYLAKTSESPNARVGALSQFNALTRLEFEVKQDLGMLPKVAAPAVQMTQINGPQINTQVNTETKVARIDLSVLSEDDRKALLRAEEALTRAETAAGPQ